MTFYLVISLIILLFLGMPIGFSLFFVSSIYFIYNGIPIEIMAQQAAQGATNYVLIAIPLFMLCGLLMNKGGMTKRLLDFSNSLFGHVKGATAQVNIFTSMIFAGMSGSAIADTAGIGGVLIPAMIEEGYDKNFSAAITAASAVVGPIIPPSIPMVITGSLTGLSVGRLFMGGAIPGILFGVLMMLLTFIISIKNNYPSYERSSFKNVIKTFVRCIPPLLLPIILVGGIISGVFTPTEAASTAASYGIFLVFIWYKTISLKDLKKIIFDSSIVMVKIMFVVSAANVYGYVLTRERIPMKLTESLMNLTTNPYVAMVLICAAIYFLGTLLSTTPVLLLTLPVLVPMVPLFGFDPLHFFVLVTLAACMGTITPPVGLTLYVASTIAETTPEKVFVTMIPYFILFMAVVGLTIIFPQIITWLPQFI